MMHLDPAWSHAANRLVFTAAHYRSSWLLAAKNESAARVQELKMTLMKKEEALKDTQEKAQQKVAGSTQMQNMRKMLQKKNDVIAALRTELRKFRPDEPAEVED